MRFTISLYEEKQARSFGDKTAEPASPKRFLRRMRRKNNLEAYPLRFAVGEEGSMTGDEAREFEVCSE